MDFRATSATRGFNWGFSRPGRIRTSNARSKIWCVTITPQANQGARRIAYALPLVESVSSAPALAMEEVCVAALETIFFAGGRAYTVWRPDSDPTSLGYGRGNTAVGKETTLAENLTLRCLA